MSVLDKFLSIMILDDEEEYEDDLFYEDEEEWIHSMITYTESRLRRKGTGKLLKKTFDNCGYPYPVIYNSRK